ncbi:MAG: 3-isopropylmalate dehydratase small subunit [Planctomycetota bacterium]|jgi:3-isopropylmalate/(R)-2-methylmalate dehydratase small subunit|nr:3-isopropylmalate dehydratase small subunit [Planctomycetota bacterium]
MAQNITAIAGRGVPVRGNDIDTDRIIPARFLRCVTFDGLGEHAFEDDRLQLKEQGKTHAFDDARFQGAKILVAGANFGCGSSREHAPQAIMRWGVEAIIGVSFAEIFFGNNVALGVPCLTASAAEVEALQSAIEADPSLEMSIDVAAATVSYAGTTLQAAIPDGPQRMWTTGQWDATGQLLDGASEVKKVAASLPYISW